MANFFFTSGEAGFCGINLDQVRRVISDTATGKVTIYFDIGHTVEFKGGDGEGAHGRTHAPEVRGKHRGAGGQVEESHDNWLADPEVRPDYASIICSHSWKLER
jgi:hypothetical protein